MDYRSGDLKGYLKMTTSVFPFQKPPYVKRSATQRLCYRLWSIFKMTLSERSCNRMDKNSQELLSRHRGWHTSCQVCKIQVCMVSYGAKVFELNAIVHWAEIKHKFSHSLRLGNKFPAVGRSSAAQVRQKFLKDAVISNWPKNIWVHLVIIMIPGNPPQVYYCDFMAWAIENFTNYLWNMRTA